MKRRPIKGFTVVGDQPFPVDMLRYDQCWPANGDAVAAMNKVTREPYDGKVTVDLYTAAERPPTSDRWRSFGYNVTEHWAEPPARG